MGNFYSVEMSKEVEMQNVKEREKEELLKWRALRWGSMKWMKNSSYPFIQLFVHSHHWIWGGSRRRLRGSSRRSRRSRRRLRGTRDTDRRRRSGRKRGGRRRRKERAMAMAVVSVRAAMPVSSTRAAAAAHTEFYDLLRVDKKASSSQLKTAYRKLALEHHPDVSQHPDANRRFAQLSNAYEVLIDPELRAVYDVSGEKGLRGRESKNRGAAWAVWESWDEFKPFQRKTRKGDARSIAAARSGVQGLSNEEGGEVTEAQSGDVVEYPLSVVVKAQHQDGRNKGVGLVVSRNKDRQDRHKLSPENLELVEIEPLFKEPESQAWRPDPMEGAAFSSLHDLRVLHVEYDRISDMWMILDELSPDCDSPVYAEEIIL